MLIDWPDPAREAVTATLRERGVAVFEILMRSPVLDHPAGNEAVLLRIPDAAPEIHIVQVPRHEWCKGADPASVLEDAVKHCGHVQRHLHELLKRYANERDRASITAVLRRQAAGELTREQAVEALGLHGVADLVKLEREFGVQGTPRTFGVEDEMMEDFERMDARDAVERKAGGVPKRDHSTISQMRLRGFDEATIKGHLHISEETALPTEEEIARETDLLVYGIDMGERQPGVDISVRVGTKMARIVVRGTDGAEETRVAHPRWAGRNAGGYVDDALDRPRAKGDLPDVPGW